MTRCGRPWPCRTSPRSGWSCRAWSPPRRPTGAPWVLVLDDFHVLTGTVGMDLVVALAMGPAVRLPHLSWHPVVGRGCGSAGCAARESSSSSARTTWPSPRTRRALSSWGWGRNLSRDAVAPLVRRTEGWPAGVYLAALSVRGAVRRDRRAGIAGSDKFIVDYFREEVLTRESADTVRFLLRTAVLDEMSGPLCDAVLGHSGSATWLAEIERRNLFVVPQDHDGRWYRYHRLFGEMLLTELRRREPGEEQRIHRRAPAWYEEHGPPDRAIAHALAARDTPTAARLVAAYGQRFYNAGRIYTVRGWLEELDDGALEEHPATRRRCRMDLGTDRRGRACPAVPARRGTGSAGCRAAGRKRLAHLQHRDPPRRPGAVRRRTDARRHPAGVRARTTRRAVVHVGGAAFRCRVDCSPGSRKRPSKAFERAAYFGRDRSSPRERASPSRNCRCLPPSAAIGRPRRTMPPSRGH